MADNIHRQTFEEILNLDINSHADRERVEWSSIQNTFKNIGKMFHHSFMFEKVLPEEAQERQKYAESVAKRHRCKVSYRAVYSTNGRLVSLMQAREELIKSMFVSPIFWTPMKSGEHCHFKTFSFGFFPYADACDTEDEMHRLIVNRINMINDGKNMSKITFEKDDWNDKKEEPRYMLYQTDDELVITDALPDVEEMTSYDYFMTVIHKCNAESLVLPEYKTVFIRTDEVYDMYGPKYGDDYKKLCKIYDALSKHIAVSDIIELAYKGKWCYCFGYDDTRYDDVYQHLGFFDTWNYFD